MVTLRVDRFAAASRLTLRWCALTMAVLALLPYAPSFSMGRFETFVAVRSVHHNAPLPGQPRRASIADAIVYLASAADRNGRKNPASAPAPTPSPSRAPAHDRPLPFASSDHTALGLVSSAVLRI